MAAATVSPDDAEQSDHSNPDRTSHGLGFRALGGLGL